MADIITTRRLAKKDLEGLPPTKTVSAMLRQLQGLGIDIKDGALRKQIREHDALIKKDGAYHLNVPFALSKYKFADDGRPIDSKDSDIKARRERAKLRTEEAVARIREREDGVAGGELIHKTELNQRVLAPAILLQRNIMSDLDKKSEEFVTLVDGDHGKSHALARELRLFVKQHLAKAYAGIAYQLSIDPVRKPQRQQSVIDD